MTGRKDDNGKLNYSIMPLNEIEEIMGVIQMGANKYEIDNWKDMEDPMRFMAAMERHYISYMKAVQHNADIKAGRIKDNMTDRDKRRDKESMKSHLAHIAVNAIFKMWHDHNQK